MLFTKKKREKAFYVYQVYSRQAEEEERYASAVIFMKKALDIDPSNTGLLLKLGDLYIMCSCVDLAIYTYRRILTISGWSRNEHADSARKAIHTLTVDRGLLQAEA